MNLDDEESLRIVLSIIEIPRFAQNDKRERGQNDKRQRAQNDRNEGPSSVSQ
jgi:hypothetical protein